MAGKGWRPISTAPRGVFVETKSGQNVQILKRGTDNDLWWMPDGTSVYYIPTHWRPSPPPDTGG